MLRKAALKSAGNSTINESHTPLVHQDGNQVCAAMPTPHGSIALNVDVAMWLESWQSLAATTGSLICRVLGL